MIAVFRNSAIGGTLAVLLIGAASAADPLPDRRGARPPSASSPAPAVAPAPAPARQELVDLLNELEALQSQVRQMRGQLEVQTHEIERLKSRQQDVFADFDRRLRELERRGAPTGGSGSTTLVTPPTVTTPSAPSARPAPGAAAAPEQQQYEAAFALMKQGQYEQAAKNFREFVARNPKGPLAANAQYWVGEAAYVMRDFRVALDEFGKVVQDYPQSNKVPDALLKIGYTHQELGANDKARAVMRDLIARFPNTTPAKVAQQRLEKLPPEVR